MGDGGALGGRWRLDPSFPLKIAGQLLGETRLLRLVDGNVVAVVGGAGATEAGVRLGKRGRRLAAFVAAPPSVGFFDAPGGCLGTARDEDRQVAGSLGALSAGLFEAAQQRGFEGRRNWFARLFGEWRRRFGDVLLAEVDDIVGFEDGSTGQQEVADSADGVEVAAGVD